jgi:hypothetical protein
MIPQSMDGPLGGAAIEHRDDRGQFLGVDRGGMATTMSAAEGGSKTCFHPFLCEGPFELCQCSCQCRLKSPQKCRLKIPHFVAVLG